MAIDLGDKRTGVAAGDLITGIASPVKVIECPIDRTGGGALLELIAAEVLALIGPGSTGAGAWGRAGAGDRGGVVLGLPLNMDGTEGPRAKLARAWAQKIKTRTGWPVELFDERLSSAMAEERLARSGFTHKEKKERRDAIAAAAVLQAFLDAKRGERGQPGDVDGR